MRHALAASVASLLASTRAPATPEPAAKAPRRGLLAALAALWRSG